MADPQHPPTGGESDGASEPPVANRCHAPREPPGGEAEHSTGEDTVWIELLTLWMQLAKPRFEGLDASQELGR
jgi:hypothetical protein